MYNCVQQPFPCTPIVRCIFKNRREMFAPLYFSIKSIPQSLRCNIMAVNYPNIINHEFRIGKHDLYRHNALLCCFISTEISDFTENLRK